MAIRGLWKRKQRGSLDLVGHPQSDFPEERIFLRALQDLAGAARGVIYDVSRTDRPFKLSNSPVYLEGSKAWRRFLRARRALDDGQLTPILSLRQLPEDERRLVVNWGTAHANTFLLLEPYEVDCDLSDSRSPIRSEVLELCRRAAEVEPSSAQAALERWTSSTALGELLRKLYGRWVWWDSPPPEGCSSSEVIRLGGASDTLSMHLLPLLYDRFPQQGFDVALAELQVSERELFGGTVADARSVFRTRLGLPVLHDPRAADRAVRQLVNLGRMSVTSGGGDATVFGPGQPVPADMPDEDFEQLLII
ncbi:MAG: hypothetical protein CL897_01445 [Dehalococcoidia bacterium]|nr:hypothetical protein [Dehalococcoidia bacterium]|tara:strand:+ start:207 stop:1127 length:921 start_codon:yes stop_codon:yes gene_type:complete